MNKRDDFSEKTKRVLALRAGMKCSFPGCRRTTCGPHSNSNKSINMGKAAHITAASLNGPRYDDSLTPEQRKSIDNGIWMCAYHADLVDKDDAKYSTVEVQKWKKQAEIRAKKEIQGTGQSINELPNIRLSYDFSLSEKILSEFGSGGITFIFQSLSNTPITIRKVTFWSLTTIEYIKQIMQGFETPVGTTDSLPPPQIGIKLFPIEFQETHDGFRLEQNSTSRFFLPICNETLSPIMKNPQNQEFSLGCILNNNEEWDLAFTEELKPLVDQSISLFHNMINFPLKKNLKINCRFNQKEPPDMSKAGVTNINAFKI